MWPVLPLRQCYPLNPRTQLLIATIYYLIISQLGMLPAKREKKRREKGGGREPKKILFPLEKKRRKQANFKRSATANPSLCVEGNMYGTHFLSLSFRRDSSRASPPPWAQVHSSPVSFPSYFLFVLSEFIQTYLNPTNIYIYIYTVSHLSRKKFLGKGFVSTVAIYIKCFPSIFYASLKGRRFWREGYLKLIGR